MIECFQSYTEYGRGATNLQSVWKPYVFAQFYCHNYGCNLGLLQARVKEMEDCASRLEEESQGLRLEAQSMIARMQQMGGERLSLQVFPSPRMHL